MQLPRNLFEFYVALFALYSGHFLTISGALTGKANTLFIERILCRTHPAFIKRLTSCNQFENNNEGS